MIRHLFKLVWNRKRANALLIVEIFFSFVVLFAVVTLAASMIVRYRKPLGFDYHDVWVATIAFPSEAAVTPEEEKGLRPLFDRMMQETRSMPEVESVAASMSPPLSSSTWSTNIAAGPKKIEVTRDNVSDDFARVMKMRVVSGRWFNADDRVAKHSPIVVDADVARSLFGSAHAIGKVRENYEIVGVVEPFRKFGELSQDHVNMIFGRVGDPSEHRTELPRNLMIRIRPGTPAEFEERLVKRLHAVAPDYPVRVRHLDRMRDFLNKTMLTPAIAAAIVAMFLIVMVALGLSGVLWQSVTRRTREIGVRRALGATGSAVNRQILAEVALLSSLAVVAGVVLIAQLPMLGVFRIVSPGAYATGLAGSLAMIYAITLLCGVYPSWLAGRVQPAQALHYE